MPCENWRSQKKPDKPMMSRTPMCPLASSARRSKSHLRPYLSRPTTTTIHSCMSGRPRTGLRLVAQSTRASRSSSKSAKPPSARGACHGHYLSVFEIPMRTVG